LSGDSQNYKRQAAARALELVEPGMILGLGTGSTANEFITLLAERIKAEELDLRCIATSKATERFASNLGIAIADFSDIADVDLTIDGADEIDPVLNLIKGGGGALLREKIVAMASDRVCIIAESLKRVPKLGAFALPVEIVDFGVAATLAMIETAAEDAGCRGEIAVRRDQSGKPFLTDGGHFIADCAFGSIPDVEMLADMLDIIPGVVEHGLFIGIADEAVVAGPEGVTELYPDDDDDELS
jgi:ribose 5-phosphate isomerase A